MTEALPARSIWLALGIGAFAAATSLSPYRIWLLAALLLAGFACWVLADANRWLLVFVLCAISLPPLPIALGNSGPHLALFPAALGVLAGILRLRDWNIRPDGLSRAFLIYLLVLAVSLAPALLYSGVDLAAASLARVFLFGIAVYIFFYTAYGPAAAAAPDTLRQIRLFFLAGTISALFACVDFYYQFPAPAGFGPQFVWLPSGVYRRAQGVFYEASTLGNLCAFFLAMIAAAFVRIEKRTGFSRVALMAGAAVFSTALIFSYSRASVLNVVVALATLLYLRRSWRILGAVLFAAAAGAVIVYAIFPASLEVYLWRWWGSAAYFFETPGRILSGRMETWQALGAYLHQNPWAALIGIGYKTLPYSNVAGNSLVADNMYLGMLVETGIAGLAALLLLNFRILQAGYRAARHPDARVSFLGSWIFCFWMGEAVQMLSGDLLTYWRVLPLYFWLLAVTVRDAHSSA